MYLLLIRKLRHDSIMETRIACLYTCVVVSFEKIQGGGALRNVRDGIGNDINSLNIEPGMEPVRAIVVSCAAVSCGVRGFEHRVTEWSVQMQIEACTRSVEVCIGSHR